MTLERKVLFGIHLLFDLLHHGFLRELVHRISAHVDRFVGLRGTGVLASSAADAILRLHFRDLEVLVHRIRIGHHVHRFCRTVLGARTASRVVRGDHAIFFDELRNANLRELLLFHRQRLNGAAGANVRADRAFVVAVARLEAHPRLHYSKETVFEKRRDEHPRRAGAHA